MVVDNAIFKREGATSNSAAGRDFELQVLEALRRDGLDLRHKFKISVGANHRQKLREFDLGSDDPRILVECKSHTWTKSGKMPSAKLTTWTMEMYLFSLVPPGYKKWLIVQRSVRPKSGESLADYYIRLRGHLIPPYVDVFEFTPETGKLERKIVT